MKILVVCTGNICRSPMGESVLRSRLDEAGIEADIVSAGVSTEEYGNPVDRRAAEVLSEHDYDVLPGHQAHQATADELREADVVLAMTVGHARALRRMMESAGADLGKLHLWREFDGFAEPAPGGVYGEGGALAPGGAEHAGSGGGGRKRRAQSDFYFSDGDLDVPDPWYGGKEGFYDTLATVERGADGIVEWLRG